MSELNALVAHQDAEGGITLKPEVLDETFLPDGEVEIAVEYSGINYKDALAVTPRGGVARSYPLIPGVDVAGLRGRRSCGRSRLRHRHRPARRLRREGALPRRLRGQARRADDRSGRRDRHGRVHRGDERQRDP